VTASGRRFARLAGGWLLVAVAMLAAVGLLTPGAARPVLAATVARDSQDGSGDSSPSATPRATASATPRPTPRPSATATPRPTPRPTASSTPRPTWTWSPRPTAPPPGAPAPGGSSSSSSAGGVRPAAVAPGRVAQIRTPFGTVVTLTTPGLTPASADPTGSVQALTSDPTAMPTAGTTVTAVGGSGGSGTPGAARPVSSSAATVETAVGLGGTAALLGMAVAWRSLRPRRRARSLAALAGGDAVAVALPESALFRSWKRELDDIADLAALTVDPADVPAAKQRRRAFSADPIAHRLVRSIEQQQHFGGA
jgi:hypothetical protein